MFALLVLLHGWATPLFEAPDEVWHYAYVRWLAEGHGLPAMDSDASGAGQEVAQPPLYYSVAALLSAPFPDEDLATLLWHNPNFGYQASGTVPDNKNMLIHTDRERVPWRGAVLAVHVSRLASLLFGGITVAASWGLGYEAFGTRRGALLTGALVAFQPQFVFISSVVNNDSAAAALSTTALWLTVRTLRRGLTHRRALLVGTVVGLAALTKTSVLLLIPLIGIALLGSAWRERCSWQKALASLSLYTLAVLALGSGWYIRNYALYGDPLGISSHVNTLWGRAEIIPLARLLPEFPLLIRSFWGAYGWGHVLWPDVVYVLLTVGAIIFVLRAVSSQYLGESQDIGLPNWGGRTIWGNLPQIIERILRALYNALQPSRLPEITRFSLLLTTGWFALVFAALLRWMQQVEAPHGRLLFPAIGAWALVLAAGMQLNSERGWIDRGFLTVMAILATLAPGARILATFAPPRLGNPEAISAKVSPVNLTYDDRARLLGVRAEPTRLSPGDRLSVEACWEAIRPIEEDYAVFVQVLGPENVQVASRRTYPGLGRFPTSLWPVERAFCDIYRMDIAPWAEAPLRYHVEIGLFDPDSTARLQARDSSGIPIEVPIVASVIVDSETSTESEMERPTIGRLGDTIALRGYDVSAPVQAGETLTVTLTWEALAPLEGDWTSFVHLWQPGTPEPVAQSDAPPRGGWYPTSVWQEGDRVPDTHTLRLPSDLAPGHYPLWAGMYHPDNGMRLPAFGSEGRYLHDLIPLGEVVVE